MFGADTPLVMDALQIAAIALTAGGGAVWLLLRRKSHRASAAFLGTQPKTLEAGTLEERVRVLERIATDKASEDQAEVLATKIEALREDQRAKEPSQ